MSKISLRKKVASLMRVLFVVSMALLLPRFFFHHGTGCASRECLSDTGFKLGIENVTREFLQSLHVTGRVNGYRVGVITNHTGIDQQGKRTIEALAGYGLRIKKIYVPEDDFHLFKKNGSWEPVDEKTGIPIALLAQVDIFNNKEYRFSDVDVLFIDLQEPGINPNTAVVTLFKVLQSAASQHKTVVVLDRPNILGATMEGITDDAIPMRYGMTVGELARYFNTALLAKAAHLFVVPMRKYDRAIFADSHVRSCGSLMTNIDIYYGSSFLQVLSLVAPFDVGQGTDIAYQCLMLPESLKFPKQKWFELRAALKVHGLESSWFCYQHPKKKIPYAGLRIMVPDVDHFSPFNAVVTIISFFKEAGVPIAFGPEFERAFGGKKVRNFLEGKFSRHELEYEVNKGLKNFFSKAQPSFMYKPNPKIVLM